MYPISVIIRTTRTNTKRGKGLKSNYEPIGNFIQPIDERNGNLRDLPLVGLSITKEFIPSIANTIGTDMTSYRIIRRNQFAYSGVTSRNSDKITIALFSDYDEALISQAYTPFFVTDENKLNPEYLMMWFRRPEFDRYARFKSHGSAREIFDWDDLCETLIPVPKIETQRAIVAEYNALQNRININQKIIQKLEETAQAIYKEWFVENVDLENLPDGWKIGTLEDLYHFQYGLGNINPDNGGKYPVYGSNGIIGGYDEFNNEDAPVIGHIGANCGSVVFAWGKHFVTYNGVMCIVKEKSSKWFSYITLLEKDLMSQTRGSSQPFVSYDMLYEIPTVIPNIESIKKFNSIVEKMFTVLMLKSQENQKLNEFKTLLLSKLASVE